MIGNIKLIGLTLGLFSTIISFSFFVRQQGTYQILQLTGLIASLISYLTILLGKETAKSRIIWTVAILLAGTIQWLTKPLLIKGSYLIYLNTNDEKLVAVNNMLKDKSDEIHILNYNIIDKSNLLTLEEKESLARFRQELNVYMISKTDNGIYYGFWGFLDVSIGLTYWTKSNTPKEGMIQLKDKWYY